MLELLLLERLKQIKSAIKERYKQILVFSNAEKIEKLEEEEAIIKSLLTLYKYPI